MKFSWLGFTTAERRLAKLKDPDPTPMLEHWKAIIVEDNRSGVLSGTDCNGKPLEKVTYRGGVAKKTLYRRGAAFGKPPVAFLGGTGDNLSAAEYRKLTGPPLAPRGEASRVIANLTVNSAKLGPGRWEVVAGWEDILSRKGRPFIHAHFTGWKFKHFELKQRDLRGVRPGGVAKLKKALSDWTSYWLKGGT
jgi:hypothetical protein